MAEITKGSRIIYKYREYDDGAAPAAWTIAFTTENGKSISSDAETTATKDGSIVTPGEPEIEITATAYLEKADDVQDDLEDAILEHQLYEVWEINLDRPKTAASSNTQYKGTYYQGYLTSFELSSASDGNAEVSLTWAINGKGARGDCTVTDAEIAAADYVFADTTAKSASAG